MGQTEARWRRTQAKLANLLQECADILFYGRVPTRGSGSPKKWQHCTPAMAAGIISQVWTVRQLLLFRIPPWRQEVAL